MPLAFESRSHGTVAFGFFQIESHMLLLNELFFFADDFCAAVETLADQGKAELPGEAELAGWRIEGRVALGDLHGAIAGQILSGFIGATYARWPFPAAPEDFRQNPEGHQTRAEVAALVEPYGQAEVLTLRWDRTDDELAVDAYVFDAPGFRRLLDYVARGGHPCWTDHRQPDYVEHMLARVANLW